MKKEGKLATQRHPQLSTVVRFVIPLLSASLDVTAHLIALYLTSCCRILCRTTLCPPCLSTLVPTTCCHVHVLACIRGCDESEAPVVEPSFHPPGIRRFLVLVVTPSMLFTAGRRWGEGSVDALQDSVSLPQHLARVHILRATIICDSRRPSFIHKLRNC